MAWAALLSGEHATLPAAELEALLAVHAPGAQVTRAAGERIPLIAHTDEAQVEAALRRAALLHEAGPLVADAPDDPGGLARAAEAIRAWATARSTQASAAVVTTRQGRTRGLASADVERGLGTALAAAGFKVDLRAPQVVLAAWLGEGRLVVVERRIDAARSAFEARVADKRSHFSPVSLHPRRAASLLHLARVAPGGRVYDPFCGTGAFVLEAALEGYEAWGSDLDAWMVQGTMQTVTDTGPEPLEATVFEADIGEAPELAGTVDGIVTDLPYGRASSSHDEALARLYDRALASFARMLGPGRRAVVGHGDPAALGDPARHGFAVAERHTERAHRSLDRHFVVLERA